jgi:tetratricopeptide (TPR) repeat protein
MYMKRLQSLLIPLLTISMIACTTDAGRTTAIGTAAGGAMGAGLGAIVGSQVGSAGDGFLLGAVAGSAAGAAVGNSVEAEEQQLTKQDTAIKRQTKEIEEQKRNLEELRRHNDDSGRASLRYDRSAVQPLPQQYQPKANVRSIPGDSPSQEYTYAPHAEQRVEQRAAPVLVAPVAKEAGSAAPPSSIFAPINSKPLWKPSDDAAVEDKPVVEEKVEKVVNKASEPVKKIEQKDLNTTASLPPVNESDSTGDKSECDQADKEIFNASNTTDTSTKLIHYRRALRLCPTNAQYHVSLGDLYRSLNRTSDAKYEYDEALKIDPTLIDVKTKSANLEGSRSTSDKY